jgi:hypothetical protein
VGGGTDDEVPGAGGENYFGGGLYKSNAVDP